MINKVVYFTYVLAKYEHEHIWERTRAGAARAVSTPNSRTRSCNKPRNCYGNGMTVAMPEPLHLSGMKLVPTGSTEVTPGSRIICCPPAYLRFRPSRAGTTPAKTCRR